MADIISLYAAARRFGKGTDTAAAHAGGPAQLLFFPGVRYERPVAAIEIEAQKKPRRRKAASETETALGS